MSKPINTNDPTELAGEHIVVATNSDNVAVYIKDGNMVTGRLLCSKEDFEAIIDYYNSL